MRTALALLSTGVLVCWWRKAYLHSRDVKARMPVDWLLRNGYDKNGRDR